MKIIFFCGSAKPGNDGVGDYTRRLSGTLIRLGYEAQILSLCDFHVPFYVVENQAIEETEVLVHRIPISTSNSQRLIWTQEIINNFQPNWISLQFVPYSFSQKGLPFWLPSFLKKLKGNQKWHIMFHELWLGIDLESSFKHKCIGKLQQYIIKKTILKTIPNLVNTQNKLYQFFLQSHDIDAHILPICSNIPLTAVKKEKKCFTYFVLFGTIHPGAPFKDFVGDLVTKVDKFTNPIKFIFIGNNGLELPNYINALESYNIDYEVLGIKSENEISQVLVDADYGISTTPYFQTEKSGIYAAYKEHRLKTICVSRKWTPTAGQYVVPHIIKYEVNNLNLDSFEVEVFGLSFIAKQFVNSIIKI
jgi:hypothetical protein